MKILVNVRLNYETQEKDQIFEKIITSYKGC